MTGFARHGIFPPAKFSTGDFPGGIFCHRALISWTGTSDIHSNVHVHVHPDSIQMSIQMCIKREKDRGEILGLQEHGCWGRRLGKCVPSYATCPSGPQRSPNWWPTCPLTFVFLNPNLRDLVGTQPGHSLVVLPLSFGGGQTIWTPRKTLIAHFAAMWPTKTLALSNTGIFAKIY